MKWVTFGIRNTTNSDKFYRGFLKKAFEIY